MQIQNKHKKQGKPRNKIQDKKQNMTNQDHSKQDNRSIKHEEARRDKPEALHACLSEVKKQGDH